MDINPNFQFQITSYEKLKEIYSFRRHIISDLRTELGHLKTCQTTLFVCICTGFFLFFGIISKSPEFLAPAYLFLIPLLLLLPLWIIFYEKARTIARIVGFIRVQEKLYMYNSPHAVAGWESAMRDYKRKKEIWDDRFFDDFFEEKKSTESPIKKTNLRGPISSVYWFSVFCTFCLMAITCLIMSGLFLNVPFEDKMIFCLSLIFVILLYEVWREYKHEEKEKKNQKNKEKSATGDTAKIEEKKTVDIQKQDSETNNKQHTDLTGHVLTSLRFTAILVGLILLLKFLLFLILFWIKNPEAWNYLTSFTLVFFWIYFVFLAAFFLFSNIALWMFRNLVSGRYSYENS